MSLRLQTVLLVTLYCTEADMPHNVQNACMQLKFSVSLQIAANKDADLLLLDANSLELRYVFAKGVLVRTPEWTRGGMFERGDRIRPINPDFES